MLYIGWLLRASAPAQELDIAFVSFQLSGACLTRSLFSDEKFSAPAVRTPK
jgi:hypothetical protein